MLAAPPSGGDPPPLCRAGTKSESRRDAVAEPFPDINGAAKWESLELQLEEVESDFRRSFDDQIQKLLSLQSFARHQARLMRHNVLVSQAAQDSAFAGSWEGPEVGRRKSVSSCDSQFSLARSVPLPLPVIELKDYSSSSSPRGLESARSKGPSAKLPPVKKGVLPWVRAAATNLLLWRFFEPMMGIVNMLSALNIGWTIDRELKQEDTKVQTSLEATFLAIFILEVLLRIFVQGLRCLKMPANLFDFVIVVITTITTILEPILAASGGEELAKSLQQLVVLRMLRLLRLARAGHLVHSFRSLWKLVQGLWHCLGTMMSAMLLMFISMYIFACFGAELITKQFAGDPEVGGLIASSFSTLPNIILTLCQFIMMDSTAAVYAPLIRRSPWLAVYFVLLLMTVTIALMNLVTALVVEDAISQAQMDDEMKGEDMRRRVKRLEPAMRRLFKTLDENGDGQVQIEEIVNSVRTGRLHIPTELREFLNPARMLDLFEAIDSDQSGDISEKEMVEGLTCVALSDVSVETMQILHILRMVKRDFDRFVVERASKGRTSLNSHLSSNVSETDFEI